MSPVALQRCERDLSTSASFFKQIEAFPGVQGIFLIPDHVTNRLHLYFCQAIAYAFFLAVTKKPRAIPGTSRGGNLYFILAKYPITQAQWKAIASSEDLKVERDLKPDPSCFKGDRRPVEEVSWGDAVEFCQRLSKQTGKEYRLPSEAEWEYACRAGTTTPFNFGETFSPKLARCTANFGETLLSIVGVGDRTNEVGQFLPNAFGLYDMHGNVWEWCEDAWHYNYEGAPTNGSAWISGASSIKIVRGGSWIGLSAYCRSAYRNNYNRDGRDNFIGLRVVCVAPRTT